MVALLGLVLFFQEADITSFAMTSELIRKDFGLGDVQSGLLNGTAFALLYAVAVIPLARIADRGHRRDIVALSLALWSLFTALTAITTGFLSLFAVRLMIGIGEAGAVPASFALIAARYPPAQRAGAIAVMQAGGYLGLVAGLWGAGLAIAHLGWRHTFLLFGVPGLALAIVFLNAVREPDDAPPRRPEPIGAVFRALRQPIILHLFAMLAASTMISYGAMAWSPAFYMRSFGMTSDDIGFWLGIAIGVGTMVGTLIGGFLSNRAVARHPNGGLIVAFWSLLLNLPLNVWAFLAADRMTSLWLLTASSVVGAVSVAPVFATLQTLTPARFRATALALISSGVTLAGQGLGPLVVGLVSDAARTIAGADSLRWSLVAMTALGLWPLYHGWRVMRLAPAAEAL